MQLKDNIKFVFDKQMSVGNENCQNLLIKGDNKAILPELASVYSGKVKCVYIDPPYNNGDSYHYFNSIMVKGNAGCVNVVKTTAY